MTLKDEISDAELYSFAREVRAEIPTDLGRPEEAKAVLADRETPSPKNPQSAPDAAGGRQTFR